MVLPTSTTIELVAYYASLLILQYVGKDRAAATISALATPVLMPQTTVETITFDTAPTAGNFTISYDGNAVVIAWNALAATIQTALRLISGLEDITVTGAIADQLLTITFVGVEPPALLLELDATTLTASGGPVTPVITETDETIPLAVQNGFNLTGSNIATGVQLDVLGEYVGVVRSGLSFSGNVTLDDADFLSLIRMAIIKNSAGSSLAFIQDLLFQFFPGEIFVFDFQDMRMTYLISTDVGSSDLIGMFVAQGLLPLPMAVGVLIVYAPDIGALFGFRTYAAAAINASPFNDYDDYQTDWPWLSYANAIIP